MRKNEQEQLAALKLRVWARQHQKPITKEAAWDAIAVAQSEFEAAGIRVHPLAVGPVMQIARIELRSNGEAHLIGDGK